MQLTGENEATLKLLASSADAPALKPFRMAPEIRK